MSFIEYIKNIEKILILVIDKITYLLSVLINNHLFKIIIFLSLITIIFIIISKLLNLSYTDTELDKERELAGMNLRIREFRKEQKQNMIEKKQMEEKIRKEVYLRNYRK